MSPLLTVTVPRPAFDPDAYLREKLAPPFDPDKYLHEKQIAGRAESMTPVDSALRGAAQSATMGFGDEIEGAVQAAGRKLLPDSLGGGGAQDAARPFAALYRESRNVARDENEAASRANPKTYFGGELAGGLAPSAIAPGGSSIAAKLLGVAGQGAVQGAGYSNADSAGGLARDSGIGAGVGLAGYGLGQASEAVGDKLSGALARLRTAAQGRAAQQAADEGAAQVASLAGRLGGEVQKGSRQVENLMRLEPSMTPAQQAELAAQRASGTVPALQQRVAQSTLEALPDQAQAIASREAELRAAQASLPQAIAARAAELQKPQMGKDALSFAKSYAEPVIAAYAADKAGEAMGLDPRARAGLDTAAGIVFGRTRAGRAMLNRLQRPGNQIGFANAAEPAVDGAGALLKALLRASPAAATPALLTQ